ncbi:MAG: hypothetical protein IBJ14_03305 [Hydrogenophaga sp.]|nr:hypothetical protein [Hydrogenophaga sp.]
MTKNLIAIASLALLGGCATSLLSSMPVTTTGVETTVFARDTIRAIAQTQSEGNKAGELVLLGDSFSYLMTGGKDQIQIMASQLRPKYIQMEAETSLLKSGDGFSGQIKFMYDSAGGPYSANEISALGKLCNRQTRPGKWFGAAPEVYFDCRVGVAGTLYASYPLANSTKANISKGRAVVLYEQQEGKTLVDPTAVAAKLLALPAALVFDVATAPLQFLLLGASQPQGSGSSSASR